jgi:hypothetical protein
LHIDDIRGKVRNIWRIGRKRRKSRRENWEILWKKERKGREGEKKVSKK